MSTALEPVALIEDEARALMTRVRRVQPFSVLMPLVPARMATPSLPPCRRSSASSSRNSASPASSALAGRLSKAGAAMSEPVSMVRREITALSYGMYQHPIGECLLTRSGDIEAVRD